jgi:hypothetical protein
MKEADRITKTDVMSLLGRTTARGVLSVYIGLPPSDRHDPARWLSSVRSGLKSLLQAHPGDAHLQEVAQLVQTEISGLPVESRHRSLVYFRSLEPDWSFCRSLQLPLADLFAWDRIPQVRPLVALLDEFPVLGIAVLSQEHVRLFTWSGGILEEHSELLNETPLEEPAPAGAGATPAATGPAAASGAGSGTGSGAGPAANSKRRVEDHARRFLHQTARRLGEAAQAHDWQRLLLIGPPSAAALVTDHLPEGAAKLLISSIERNLIKAAPAEIAETAVGQLGAWKRRAEVAEVEALINDARSSRRACLGLQATLGHLKRGGVERLLFCHDLQVSGFREADGGLLEHRVGPESIGSLSPEPHLVERMITASLESGATVVPLEGPSSERLILLGGVGARLRWRGPDGGHPLVT